MRNFFIFLLFSFLIFQSISCGGLINNDTNIYRNDELRVLDEMRTLGRIKEIDVSKNDNGYDDIIIHAFNGTEASFYSNNPCGGPGPAYSIIGSIPKLGIVFLDRTYSCHMGGTTIMVSLKDGIYRELKNSFWNVDQLSISPNGSWLVISNADCSMEYSCNIEILSLEKSTNSLLNSVYSNPRVCARNNNISWFSDNGFNTETAIGENNGKCVYKSVQFNFSNNEWVFGFK